MRNQWPFFTRLGSACVLHGYNIRKIILPPIRQNATLCKEYVNIMIGTFPDIELAIYAYILTHLQISKHCLQIAEISSHSQQCCSAVVVVAKKQCAQILATMRVKNVCIYGIFSTMM